MKNTNEGSGSATTETALAILPESTISGGLETLPLGSINLSGILKEAASDTMNYADNCMSELLSQMEQVRSSTESPETEKMASIAMGARSLAEVMREKISAMKLLKEGQ